MYSSKTVSTKYTTSNRQGTFSTKWAFNWCEHFQAIWLFFSPIEAYNVRIRIIQLHVMVHVTYMVQMLSPSLLMSDWIFLEETHSTWGPAPKLPFYIKPERVYDKLYRLIPVSKQTGISVKGQFQNAGCKQTLVQGNQHLSTSLVKQPHMLHWPE